MEKTKSYSGYLLRQRVLRGLVCLFFCVIALTPFILMVMNATRSSDAIKSGIS